MTGESAAPAETPAIYRIADEFERELFAWRNLPSRDGAALRACAYALAQKAETLFAPILAEKEREIATFENREAEWNEAIANSLQNEEDAHRKLEAAEAALAGALRQIADTRIARAQALLDAEGPRKLHPRVAAIRAQGE